MKIRLLGLFLVPLIINNYSMISQATNKLNTVSITPSFTNNFDGLQELLGLNERSVTIRRKQTVQLAKKFIGPFYTRPKDQEYQKKLVRIDFQNPTNSAYIKAIAVLDKSYPVSAKYIRTATQFEYEELRKQLIINLVQKLKKENKYSVKMQILMQESTKIYQEFRLKSVTKEEAINQAKLLLIKYPYQVAIIKATVGNQTVANTKFVKFRL